MTEASINVTSTAADRPLADRRRVDTWVRRAGLPAVLALLLLVFGLLEPTMLRTGNLRNTLVQSSYLVIFACAQMVVIVVRGFDLSLGTSVSTISVASSMVMIYFVQAGMPTQSAVPLEMLCGLGIGAIIGAANGFVVTYLNVNLFVATFWMLNICFGLSSSISGGFQIFDLPSAFNESLYRSAPLGVPVPVVADLLVLATYYVLFEHTRFGRSLFILGSIPRAAAVAGHNHRALLAGAYVVCSTLVALGALLQIGRAHV